MSAVDLALLVLRVVLGITFLAHGSQKLFGWFGGSGINGVVEMMGKLGVAHPKPLAWMATLSEFGGGLLILLGLLTPLAAAFIISTMLVAIATVHLKNGFFAGKRGFEFNLNLCAMALALILTGAGTVSVDHLLGIAVPLDQLPIWTPLLLVVIMVGGLFTTEMSRRATATQQVGSNQQGV